MVQYFKNTLLSSATQIFKKNLQINFLQDQSVFRNLRGSRKKSYTAFFILTAVLYHAFRRDINHYDSVDIIGLLHGYGLIKRGFKSRLGWRPWEPS